MTSLARRKARKAFIFKAVFPGFGDCFFWAASIQISCSALIGLLVLLFIYFFEFLVYSGHQLSVEWIAGVFLLSMPRLFPLLCENFLAWSKPVGLFLFLFLVLWGSRPKNRCLYQGLSPTVSLSDASQLGFWERLVELVSVHCGTVSCSMCVEGPQYMSQVQATNAYHWSYLDEMWQSHGRSFHHEATGRTVGVFTEEEIKIAFSGEICWDQEVPPSVPQECQSIINPSVSLHNGGLTGNILWVDFQGSKAVTNSQFAYFPHQNSVICPLYHLSFYSICLSVHPFIC